MKQIDDFWPIYKQNANEIKRHVLHRRGSINSKVTREFNKF